MAGGLASEKQTVVGRPMTLEEMFEELERYGRPILLRGERGWSCTVDLNTAYDGMEGSVRSEFGKNKPIDAASQCLNRVRKALE